MTEPNSKFQDGSSPEINGPEEMRLVSFLQANASVVPEPAPDLENRLMQVILQDSPSPLPLQQNARRRDRLNWRSVALIGVGLATVGVGWGQLQRWFAPPSLTTAELAQVEPFIVEGWNEAVQPTDSSTDWDWVGAKFVNPVVVFDAGVDVSLASSSQP